MNSCLLKNAETVSENQTANHPGSSHYRRMQPTEPGLCLGYDWKFSRLRIGSFQDYGLPHDDTPLYV